MCASPNLENGKSAISAVLNDRGPFYSDRIIDLSFAAAKKLGYAESGTARVKVERHRPARVGGLSKAVRYLWSWPPRSK